MKHSFKSALVSFLLLTASPAFAIDFAILGGPGTLTCKVALKEMKRSHTAIHFIMIWLGGMATGVNFATPGLRDINPETSNENLFRLVVKQCQAEPNQYVAEAAGTIFKRVAAHEGLWSKTVDGAERID